MVTAIPGASIAAGIYYIAANSGATASISTAFWNVDNGAVWANGILNNVTGKPVINGVVAITPNTPPTTITPSAIQAVVDNKTLIFRLDN